MQEGRQKTVPVAQNQNATDRAERQDQVVRLRTEQPAEARCPVRQPGVGPKERDAEEQVVMQEPLPHAGLPCGVAVLDARAGFAAVGLDEIVGGEEVEQRGDFFGLDGNAVLREIGDEGVEFGSRTPVLDQVERRARDGVVAVAHHVEQQPARCAILVRRAGAQLQVLAQRRQGDRGSGIHA